MAPLKFSKTPPSARESIFFQNGKMAPGAGKTPSLADKLIDYLSTLKVPQGPDAGNPFIVLPWQRTFIKGAFKEPWGHSLLTVARGNGKTTLLAGIICAAVHERGPLHNGNQETLVVAASLEQAKVCWRHIVSFLAPVIDSAPRGSWRTLNSAGYCSVTNRRTGAAVRLLGQNPRTAHGRAPALILCDEVAQWPPNKAGPMLAALRTSFGKQASGHMIYLGTRHSDPTHWSRALEHDRSLLHCQVHAATDKMVNKRPGERKTWIKANPSMPFMPALERAIKADWKQAKQDLNVRASFKALRLNAGVEDSQAAWLIEPGRWREAEVTPWREPPDRGPLVWGVDLGGSSAMSAVAGYCPVTGALKVLAAFPLLPPLDRRGSLDGVGSRYTRMKNEGTLIQLGQGRTVPVDELVMAAVDSWGRPSAIVCDRWRVNELHDALVKAELQVPVITRGQGFKDGNTDVRLFRRAVLEGRVKAPKCLLLRSGLSEARVVSDPAHNIKLATKTAGNRRLNARDDIVAATILAVAAGRKQAATTETPLRTLVV